MPAARSAILLLALAALALPALAQPAAGRVEALGGEVFAVSPQGLVRRLDAGAPVFSTEEIRTGDDASVTLRFEDGTRLELGEDATLRVDRFALGGAEESMSATVVKGIFRFVSGLIAKRRAAAVSLNLSVASIGIRGTHVAGEVTETSARVVLLEPEDPEAGNAIEVSNQYGSVVVDEPGWGTEIPDRFSPPSPPRRMALRAIQNMMRGLQSIQRIRVPRIR